MKNKYQIILGIILFATITGFVLALSFALFNGIVIEGNEQLKSISFGAFAGAFFAFIFLRLSEMLTRYSERQKKNYNAIVKLQHICISLKRILTENLGIADILLDQAENIIQKNEQTIMTNRFITTSLDRATVLDLTNVDLINMVTVLYNNIEFMNSSVQTANYTLQSFFDLFGPKFMEGGQQPIETYKRNIVSFQSEVSKLKNNLGNTVAKAVELLATARVLGEDMPIYTRLTSTLLKRKLTSIDHDKIEKEIGKVLKEMSPKNNDKRGHDT